MTYDGKSIQHFRLLSLAFDGSSLVQYTWHQSIMLKLSSYLLGIPNYAHKSLSHLLMGCSLLSQEYCGLIRWYSIIMKMQFCMLPCHVGKSIIFWNIFYVESVYCEWEVHYDMQRQPPVFRMLLLWLLHCTSIVHTCMRVSVVYFSLLWWAGSKLFNSQ